MIFGRIAYFIIVFIIYLFIYFIYLNLFENGSPSVL